MGTNSFRLAAAASVALTWGFDPFTLLVSRAAAQTASSSSLMAAQQVQRSGDRLDNLEKQREKLTSTRQELQAKIDQQLIERQELQARQRLVDQWRPATLALLSQRSAVALQADSDGSLKVMAVARYPESDYIARLIQRFNIPCLAQDDRLTESLATLDAGALVSGSARQQLNKYWCRHKYVPVSKNEPARYVLFNDLERKAPRLGLLVDLKSDSLLFHPVAGKSELVQRSRIESGSAKAGDAQRIKGEEQVDFLDLCVLRAAQLLESDENVPSFQAVALTIQVDELEEALKLSKELDKTWRDGLFDYLARSQQLPYVRDQRKEPARILREFGMTLEDQLRGRLSQLGVPLVEREELQTIIAERELSETKHFDNRNYRKLNSASHMVIAEVGRPTAGGAFRVDFRLVDVHSGNILMEDSDDIGKPETQLASTFNVQAGQLMVMTSRAEGKAAAMAVKQKSLLLDAFDPQAPMSRLVRFERNDGSELVYYDLFDNLPKSTSINSAMMQPVGAAGAMPRDEKLRWLSWQIYNTTLPTAGKVLTMQNGRVTLNIGSAQGIANGDTFRVLRVRDSGQSTGSQTQVPTQTILPVELRADEVSGNHSTAFIVDSEVTQLWNEFQVEPGDLVLRRGSRDVNVQLLPPVTDTRHWQGDVAKRVNGWGSNQKMRLSQKMAMFGKAFIDSTTSGLQQVGLMTSSEYDDRASGSGSAPTHQVVCYVAPLAGNTECSQFGLKLEIKEVQSGKLLQTIGPIQFHESEVLNWRP